jgi:hypothetical protein
MNFLLDIFSVETHFYTNIAIFPECKALFGHSDNLLNITKSNPMNE